MQREGLIARGKFTSRLEVDGGTNSIVVGEGSGEGLAIYGDLNGPIQKAKDLRALCVPHENVVNGH